MKILKTIGVYSLFFLFASCSTVRVVSDVDSTVDFTKFKTFEYYGWANESDKLLNDLDKRRIESAFGDEFYKRGLGIVGKDGELMIALYIVVEQKQQTTASTTTMGGGYGGYYGYGPGYGWGVGHSTTNINTYDYEVGTLVVSVYDKKEERLIWESSASGELNDDPKNRNKTIPYVVAKIMKEYPVAMPNEE